MIDRDHHQTWTHQHATQWMQLCWMVVLIDSLFHISVLYMYGSLFWQLIIRPIAIYLTPWSTALHEQPAVSQPVNKFPVFYRKWKFITVFTTACHLSFNSARSTPFLPSHPGSWWFIVIYSPISTCVFQVISFAQVSLQKPCTHISSSPYMPNAPSISYFLNWSLKSFDKSDVHRVHRVEHHNIFL